MNQILVIDDNQGIATALEVLFSLYDIETIHADSPEKGLFLLQSNPVDLVVQDMNFSEDTTSGEEGHILFNQIHTAYPDLPVILLTAWGNLEMAVELVKAGAADYLTKPWDDNKLITTVKNLIELGQLRQQTNSMLSQKSNQANELANQYDLCGTIFSSQRMLQSLTMATQVAHSDIPVLITGPNGSGKEKIAETIQANSSVKDKPFVKVNIGALPVELLEAELFGAEAGAFTGAAKKRIGRFESADGGTLFLDEIGNLPLSGQIKLLRVLQTGEFERLGSSETRKVNVRVISATNADLLEEIKTGQFREDLYYRLNVIEIKVAPLSQRVDDILPLALHFMPDDHTLSHDAERTLLNYAWPGNVRELENVIKRASLLAKNKRIEAEDFGISVEKIEVTQRQSNEPDKAMIIQALAENKNNISQAAKQLGLSRQSLYRRMDKFSIPK
ncbi:sigma-54-dependent transcriptional regulator [Aliikangiella coralliicola]|uniref:Sigma-54-dependent Fis family transcriptional regulator n=1 Tax=Aliikangiella coralliicola TaxID=2592383 RepID=A0A545U6H3_9GAMM|nr:sigma-54 dependent transcriptional regulator [Aliikangiella coralliicola]TQV85034.1 sigma-54-dependent Fis family transcriptional regulator [Aliikangiella coralliicola]